MIILLNSILVFLAIYLQTGVLRSFHIFGLMPNIVLIFVVSLSLFRKGYEAYAFAFLTGLILDTLSSGPYGIHIAVLMITVFSAKTFLSEDGFVSNAVYAVFQSVVPIVFYAILGIYIAITSGRYSLSGVEFMTGEVLITIVVALLIYPLIKKLFLWETSFDESKRRTG